jgi:hypothetical protein
MDLSIKYFLKRPIRLSHSGVFIPLEDYWHRIVIFLGYRYSACICSIALLNITVVPPYWVLYCLVIRCTQIGCYNRWLFVDEKSFCLFLFTIQRGNERIIYAAKKLNNFLNPKRKILDNPAFQVWVDLSLSQGAQNIFILMYLVLQQIFFFVALMWPRNFFACWPKVCVAQVPIPWFDAFGRECNVLLGQIIWRFSCFPPDFSRYPFRAGSTLAELTWSHHWPRSKPNNQRFSNYQFLCCF